MHNNKKSLDLSILVPIYNEEENLPDLYNRIDQSVRPLGKTYEILLVDDGSKDRSFEIISELARKDEHIKGIQFRKNFGQTAAISAGLKASQGKIIVMMDGDLQNDPADIAKLLEKIDAGFDVVSGWRRNRQDAFFSRILPSRIANAIISFWTGIRLKDYGCTLKAYRAEVITGANLYGEMHRFLPFYASLAGAKICEVPVQHHPRTRGKSKYGISRTFKVLLDLITIHFLGHYAHKPLYFFGSVGSLSILISASVAMYTLYQKYVLDIWVHRNPLLMVSAILFLGGLQFLFMGLLAEILMRTYHESQDKPTYLVKSSINTNEDSA